VSVREGGSELLFWCFGLVTLGLVWLVYEKLTRGAIGWGGLFNVVCDGERRLGVVSHFLFLRTASWKG